MWRERLLFLGIGALLGVVGAMVGAGRPRPEASGGAAADASAPTIARLERRIAELEALADRPARLAVPSAPAPAPAPVGDGSPSPAAAGGPTSDPTSGPATASSGAPPPLALLRSTLAARVDAGGNGFLPGVTFTSPRGELTVLPAAPMPSADEVDRLVRLGTDAERAQGVAVLQQVSDAAYLPVARRALDGARDEAETRGLMNAIARLKDRPWSAYQVTGAPDTPIGGDHATAWASKTGDMGEVTLDLTYDRAVRVDRVRIHETYNPGAVARIYAKGPDGEWDLLWEGVAPASTAPTWFAPSLSATRYATSGIRLVLDTNRVPDWNELDAVELEGDGVRQWAAGAVASSSYADAR